MFTHQCPSCHVSLDVNVDFAGHQTRCPQCKNPYTIPQPTKPIFGPGKLPGPKDTQSYDHETNLFGGIDGGDYDDDRKPSRYRPRQRSSATPWIIATIVLLSIAGGAVWFAVESDQNPAATEGTPAGLAKQREAEKAVNISPKGVQYQTIVTEIEALASKIESVDFREVIEASITGGTPAAREHATQVAMKAIKAYQKHTSALLRRQAKLLRDDPSPLTVESIAKILDSVCSETLSANVLNLIDSVIPKDSASDRNLALSAIRAYRKGTSQSFSDAAKQIRQLNR